MELATIQNKIYRLPNRPPFMLAQDLADIYGTEPKRINEAVKRNPDRFPEDFYFQLTKEESEMLVSQNVIPNEKSQNVTLEKLRSQNATAISSMSRTEPYGFTREGANMLSTVLKTKTSAARAVQIMRAFSAMEEMAHTHRAEPPGIDAALLRMEDRIVARVTAGLAARMLPPAAPAAVAPRLPVYLETLPNGRLLRCCHYSNQSLVYASDLLEVMDIPLKNANVPGTLAFVGFARESDFLVVPVATMAQAFQCSPRELLDALTLTRKQRQLTWLTAQGIAQSSSEMAEWFADRSKMFARLKRIYINR